MKIKAYIQVSKTGLISISRKPHKQPMHNAYSGRYRKYYPSVQFIVNFDIPNESFEHKIHSLNIETKKFMKENSEIKILLKEYFSDQNCLYYAKDGEEMSIQDFIITILRDKSIINAQEITEKLNQNKHLWKTIMQGNY